jgi:hypothetical protein
MLALNSKKTVEHGLKLSVNDITSNPSGILDTFTKNQILENFIEI